MSKRASASVYRFRDLVGVSLPEGPTQYFSRTEAVAIARAMNAVAAELKAGVPFADSAISSKQIPVARASS